MAEVGTHDDLAAYEIQDVVGLEDATERGRGSFGAVYEVEVYGVPCVAKCLHDILIGYQQQFKGPMRLDEEGVDAIRSNSRRVHPSLSVEASEHSSISGYPLWDV